MRRCKIFFLRLTRTRPVPKAIRRSAQPGAALDDARPGYPGIGVRCPFPEVAYHVMEAQTVRREASHGGDSRKTVLRQVYDGKQTLPGICFLRLIAGIPRRWIRLA